MNGHAWSPVAIARLRELYADTPTKRIARLLKHSTSSVYGKAESLGLKKSPAQLAAMGFQIGSIAGIAYRFKPGIVPWNKGISYQAGGRSAEFRFKPGNVSKRWDPETYHVGALRLNGDGYVDMKIKEGSRAWRDFKSILWEDAHGPVPKSHCIVFRDRDQLNLCLENFELISRAELMRRNTIHNLPAELKSTVNLLGQLKRRIREKQDRGSEGPFIRDTGRSAGQRSPDAA